MAQTYRLPMSEALLDYAMASPALEQRKSVPSTHMRWRMPASFRACATRAFFVPRRLTTAIAQAPSVLKRTVRVSITLAASKSALCDHPIADLGDPPGHIELARLILPRRQPKVRPDIARVLDARRIVDPVLRRWRRSHRRWNADQLTADRVCTNQREQLTRQALELRLERSPWTKHRVDHVSRISLTGEQLTDPISIRPRLNNELARWKPRINPRMPIWTSTAWPDQLSRSDQRSHLLCCSPTWRAPAGTSPIVAAGQCHARRADRSSPASPTALPSHAEAPAAPYRSRLLPGRHGGTATGHLPRV